MIRKMRYIAHPLESLWDHFVQAPVAEQLILGMIALNVFGVSVLLVLMVLDRWNSDLKKKHRDQVDRMADELVTTYLFEEDHREHTLQRLRKITRGRRDVQSAVIRNMLQQKKNFMGEVNEDLNHLYRELQLDEVTMKRLHSRSWETVTLGVREASLFELEEAFERIVELTGSKVKFLRMECLVALVQQKKYHVLNTIANLDHRLSEWECLILLEKLVAIPVTEAPDFTPWLRSSNHTLVLFSLHLVRISNQYEAADQVLELITHERENIRKLAVHVCNEMVFADALDTVIECFDSEPSKAVKLEMLRTIGLFGETNHHSHQGLLFELLNGADFQLSLAAAKALGDLGLLALTTVPAEKQALVKHAQDDRL